MAGKRSDVSHVVETLAVILAPGAGLVLLRLPFGIGVPSALLIPGVIGAVVGWVFHARWRRVVLDALLATVFIVPWAYVFLSIVCRGSNECL
jgi:hypothetical protein